jgi:hypothetical protein
MRPLKVLRRRPICWVATSEYCTSVVDKGPMSRLVLVNACQLNFGTVGDLRYSVSLGDNMDVLLREDVLVNCFH